MLGLWARLPPGQARLVHMVHDEFLIEVAAPALRQVRAWVCGRVGEVAAPWLRQLLGANGRC